MAELILTHEVMRKYRNMGFNRHLIREAWDGCIGRESSLMKTLLEIRSRDQLRSEQRLAWDGQRAQIKRIVNRTQLNELSTPDCLKEFVKFIRRSEFQKLRKKGLLRKKEFRGSRGLSLEFDPWLDYEAYLNEDIRRLAKHMKGYLRRLRHFSIKYEGAEIVSMVPLLKSIRHNFVGLVSLKLSLEYFRLLSEDLDCFKRLFAGLRPTLKHLDLEFGKSWKYGINFPEMLGQIIMKNLAKLETLCLSFQKTQFAINVVRFFIKIACPQMKDLRSLSISIKNCWIYREENLLSQVRTPSNLKCLKFDFDPCINLSTEYLSILQKDIIAICPALEELYIRLPNYRRFSGGYGSIMKEKFLERLNLKRIAVELSHEIEDIWNDYQDILDNERTEERRVENLARKMKREGYGEEDIRQWCDILIEDDQSSKINENDWDLPLDIVNTRKWEEWNEFDEEEEDLMDALERDREIRERNEIEEQDEAERILYGK